MAIQFPNFLAAQLMKPDYSGLGDIVSNFYAGKEMPKNDLIKQIQAEFARPNAEQTLQGLKLGNVGAGLTNQKSMLEIAKFKREQAQEAEIQRLFSNALRNGGNIGVNPAQSSAPMPSFQQPQMNNPAIVNALQNQLQQNSGASNAPTAPSLNPIAPFAPTSREMPSTFTQPMEQQAQSANQPTEQAPANNNMQVITEGTPRLASIDTLWDQNPLSREFLKKKGFEKKTDVKFDQKTGQTRVITTYPSGKTTLEIIGTPGGANGEVPITTANVTKNQSIISAIDNTIPVIKDILALDKGTTKNTEWEPYPRSSGFQPGLGWLPGYQSKSTNYEGLVSSALDTLLGAYGLPKTNEGIETVKKQLLIGHGETDSAYKARLNRLIKDLERRKDYSSSLLKKATKNPPRDSGAGETYSSDEYEVVNE
jgi:hypothetical protein